MSVSSFKKLEPEEYLRQHYQQGLRPDGRKGLTSLRPVSISVGSISVADGSAVVKQGDTIVVSIRGRPRFFDQVGHQTINASIGNKHFFTK